MAHSWDPFCRIGGEWGGVQRECLEAHFFKASLECCWQGGCFVSVNSLLLSTITSQEKPGLVAGGPSS